MISINFLQKVFLSLLVSSVLLLSLLSHLRYGYFYFLIILYFYFVFELFLQPSSILRWVSWFVWCISCHLFSQLLSQRLFQLFSTFLSPVSSHYLIFWLIQAFQEFKQIILLWFQVLPSAFLFIIILFLLFHLPQLLSL